jgi:hypothetical protein
LDELAVENRRLEAGRAEDIGDLKHKVDTVWRPYKTYGGTVAFSSYRFFFMLQTRELSIQPSNWFDSIDYRYNSIPIAHAKTFSWIFGPETKDGSPFDSFPKWLTSGNDLFWISGKPGSGKLTLIKYLRTYTETERMLNEWARGHPLIVVNFFFWNAAGQSLQKSQQGLLRFLIYQILRQRPDLIRQAFPDIDSTQPPSGSKKLKRRAFRVSSPPEDNHGLLSTLQNICGLLASSDVRLFFLIDGLNKFEGKPNNIIELISIFKSLRNVKMCAFSRPWNEFDQSFSKDSSRKLYMHLLTKTDIRNYIRDTLENDENYQNLEEIDESAKALINEIIDAAQGVFL